MNIYVFNQQFQVQGIVESFKSVIWRRDYYKTGTVEIHIDLPDNDEEASELIALLQKQRLLVKDDSLDEAAYIERIALADEETDTLVISGFCVQNILSQRLVWGTMNKKGNVEEVIKYFVDRNVIHPDNINRVIPNFMLSSNRGVQVIADEINSWGNLVDLVETWTMKYDVGTRVIFDLAQQRYIFDVYQGKDLSVNQDINPHAVFALEYENVLNQSYTDSDDNYKNVAVVAGEDETTPLIITINNQISGFERRELFIDAKDVSKTKEDETNLTDQEYKEALTQYGQSKLSEAQSIQTFDSGISLTSNLVYKQDFDLGDIVTIQNKRWGITLDTRITVVEEVYENDTKDIRVNFGQNIPTLMDKIKQKMG